MLLREREADVQAPRSIKLIYRSIMATPSESQSRTSTPRSFATQTVSAEDLLKSQTVGLVNLSEFRKRRADILEQKEREAHDKSLGRLSVGNSRSATPSFGDVTDGGVTGQSDSAQPPRKKRNKKAKSKLSFDDDENDAETELLTRVSPVSRDTRSPSKNTSDGTPQPRIRKLAPNPNLTIPAPKAMTKASIEAEAQMRDVLRKEFLVIQEKVKATEILIPFVFYDGTNIPAGKVKVKKGDPVWLFLDRCRKVGAELGVGGAGGGGKGRRDNRREWARVGVDDLMLVRGDIIIPHHYEFYYFIANRVPSFTSSGGLLFDYSNTAPAEDDQESPLPLEGADMDPTFTKVVDRRWFERNKHIFPASLWREFEPGKEFEEKMRGVRRDNQGNTFFF
ncbi:XAP5 domain-containing protein [Coccidioides immitis RS]|uniref:XAP5 domain-containing protein n=3 Tax=Coccidioides immitis TaxID=5501 RepID=A0A0D8JT17_COCIM|nr:XAP5 domain-containing protein [Coccidioides immitis RS]KJF60437.1 XAP5 domain-containing protein [Coccidioides immitis RS]KMP02743.1 hypothetical protein CIRG_02435 [Coccidioides immitis RMSCC 2394]KMU81350.1 hypothetical protein CISG_08995 [Coccidioides immitis RMSCC 3703]